MMLNEQEASAACQGCNQLKQKLEQCKMEHTLKYTTLKQKIMLVDELIRQYQAKSQENSLLKNKLEEVASRLSTSRKDCKVLEEQLSNTLKEIIPIRSENTKLKLENKQLKKNNEKLSDEQGGNEALCRQLRDLLSRREEELQTVTSKLNNYSGSDLKNLAKVKEDNVALKKDNSELKKKNWTTNNKLSTSKNRERQLRELLSAHNVPIPRLKKLDKEVAQKSNDSSAEEDLLDFEALQELLNKKSSSVSKQISQNDQETQTISIEEPVNVKQDLKNTPESRKQQIPTHTVAKRISTIESPKQHQHQESRNASVFRTLAAFDIKKMPACLSPMPPSPFRNHAKDLSEDGTSDEEDAMSVIADQIDIELENVQDSPQEVPSTGIANKVESPAVLKSPTKRTQHFDNTPQRMTRSRTRNSSSSCQDNDPVPLPKKVKKRSCRKNKTDDLQSHLSGCKSLSDTSDDEHSEINSKRSIDKHISNTDDVMRTEEFKIAEEIKCAEEVSDYFPCATLSEDEVDKKLIEPLVNCDHKKFKEPTEFNTGLNGDPCKSGNGEQKIHLEVNLSNMSEKKDLLGELIHESDSGTDLPDIRSAMADKDLRELGCSTGTNIIVSDSEKPGSSEIGIVSKISVDYVEAIPDGNNDLGISSNLDSPVDGTSQDNILIDPVEKQQSDALQENESSIQNDCGTSSVEARIARGCMKQNVETCIVKPVISENKESFIEDEIGIGHQTERNHHDDRNENSEVVSPTAASFHVAEEMGTDVSPNIAALKITSKTVPKITPSVSTPSLSKLYSSFVKASVVIENNESEKLEIETIELKENRRIKEAKTDKSDGKSLGKRNVDEGCFNTSNGLAKGEKNIINTVSEIKLTPLQSKKQSNESNLTSAGENPDKIGNVPVFENMIAEVVKETDLVALPQRRVTRSMGDIANTCKTSVERKSSKPTCKRHLPEVDDNTCQKKQKKSVCQNEWKKPGSRITRSMKGNRTGTQDDDAGSNTSLVPSSVITSADESGNNTASCRASNIVPNIETFSTSLTNVISCLEAKEPVECGGNGSTANNNVISPQWLIQSHQSTAACKSLVFERTEKDQSNNTNNGKCDTPSANALQPSRRSDDNRQPTRKANQPSQRFISRVQKRSIQLTSRPLVSPIPISPLTLSHHPPPLSPMNSSRGSTPTLRSLSQRLPSLIPLPNPVSPLPVSPRKTSLRNCPPFLNQLPVAPISPLTLPSAARHLAPGSSSSLAPRLSPLLDPQPSSNIPVQRPRKFRLAHRPTYSPDVPSMVSRKSERSVPSSPVSPPRIHASVPEGAVTVKPSRSTERLSAFRCPTPEMNGSNRRQKSSLRFAASNSLLKNSSRQSSFTKPVSNYSTSKSAATCTDQQKGHSGIAQQKCHPGVAEQKVHQEVTQEKGHPRVAQEKGHPGVVQQKGHPRVAQEKGHPGVAQEKGHPGVAQQQGQPGMVQQKGRHPGEVAGNGWCQIAKTQFSHEKNNKKRKKKKKKKVPQKQKSFEVQRLEYQVNAERILEINVEDRLEFLVSQISNVTNDATANSATSCLICFLILNHVNLLPVIKAMCESGNKSTKVLITPHEEMLINAISANETLNFAAVVLHHLKQALFSVKEMQITEDKISVGMTLCRCYTALCRCKGLAYADHVRILLYDIISQKADNVPHLVLSVISVWPSVLQGNTSSPVDVSVKTIVSHQLQCQIEQGQYTATILQNCFKYLYDWPVVTSQPLSGFCVDLVKKLGDDNFAIVTTNADGDSILSPATYDHVKAIELVAGQLGWAWLKYQLMDQILLPMIEFWMSKVQGSDSTNEGSICTVLQIIGELSTQGLSCNLESVMELLTKIGRLLQMDHNASVSWKTQIFVVKTLMRLSPSNPQYACELINGWMSQSSHTIPAVICNAFATLAGSTAS